MSAPTDKRILRERERVERRLAHAWALYEDTVWRIAKDAQDKVVNPFMDANPGMKIVPWRGKYAVYKDGEEWGPEEEGSDIFDLLDVKVEGYWDALATWMKEYPVVKND